MDNAPCHPGSLKGQFSNINVIFLPQNTTSKTQQLDAGIIASWKVLYRKRMLRYVCSKVDGVKNAAEIVKSINVLMAINAKCSAEAYIVSEDEVAVWPRLIDPSEQNWREAVPAELLDDNDTMLRQISESVRINEEAEGSLLL